MFVPRFFDWSAIVSHRDLWGVLVTFISHYREKKGAPLRGIIQARSSALRDSIGRGIEGPTGSCPSNHGHPSHDPDFSVTLIQFSVVGPPVFSMVTTNEVIVVLSFRRAKQRG